MEDITKFIRPNIVGLQPYVGGIQVKDEELKDWIKMNQNEFPYDPPPAVREAVVFFGEKGYTNRYPDGTYGEVKEALAQYHNVKPEQVTVGNGSDEVLLNMWLSFVSSGDRVVFPYPEYGMPPIYCKIQDGKVEEVDLNPDFTLPVEEFLKGRGKLTFISNPNTPIGTFYMIEEIERLLKGLYPDGLVIVDEAYADFAPGNCIDLLKEYPNLLITRTFSKVFGMARLRFGYGMGHKDLIKAVESVRLPYNINGAAEVAALAAVRKASVRYEERKERKIIEDRESIAKELSSLGFYVYPSGANFIFTTYPIEGKAKELYERLIDRKCLVRYFPKRRLENGIRVTVGTTEENKKFIGLVKELMV